MTLDGELFIDGLDDRDLEEDEKVLDDQYETDDTIGFWEGKQRDLLSSAVDYNLRSLADLVRSKQVDTSPRYQRRNRWGADRKSALIESFLMNVPVPPIFLNEDEYGRYSVIDGKQRLTAITDFLLGRFKLQKLKVFSELNDLSFDDLPTTLQTVLETRANIRAIIILRQSDANIKYEVFQRLNTGGIRLNPQEIRNSAWPGLLNDMILDEAISPDFHNVLGIRDKSKSALYREMRDAEFVLRFLTFKDDWDTFSGGMGRRLDQHMVEHHDDSREQVEEARLQFRSAVRAAGAAFGEQAFKRFVPDREIWRQQVLASMYDAEIFAARYYPVPLLEANQDKLIQGLEDLFRRPAFRQSVDSATNTPSYFKARIKAVKDLIETTIDA